jgi:hypothetical protein
VAILNQGTLRGVGAVEELTAGIRGQSEFVWSGTTISPGLTQLGADCHVAGDTVRAVVPSDRMDAALDVIKRERLRLISVTPVRTSLEDYFLAQLTPVPEEAKVAANGNGG